jgi:hypothetical protein
MARSPRHPPEEETGARHWAPYLLAAIALLLVLFLYRDFGITWDETVQAEYGELVLDYFRSGGSDRTANEYLDLRFYGPLFESAAAAVYQTMGWPRFEVRHLLVGIAALLTLVGLLRYADLLRDVRVTWFAGLALLTMPRFVGHAFNNSKDIPYACAFAWAMFAIGRIVVRRSLRWTDVLLAGGAVGLALSTRVGGLLLFGYLAAGLVMVWGTGGRELRAGGDGWAPRAAALRLGTLAGVAWIVMVAFWPWAHQNPIWNPVQAFLQATDFSAVYPQLFEGQMISSDQLPRRYLPQYLLIATPPMLLLLSGAGVLSAARALLRDRGSERARFAALTLLWLFFPIAYVVLMRPNVYNGMRHFLFLLPALALLAALGAVHLLDRFRPGRARAVAAAALVVAFLLPVPSLVHLHPYQMTYFNGLVGGVGGAWERYDTDYWASSYREAALWVNENPQPGPDGRTVVLVTANAYSRMNVAYYLDAEVELHTIWDDGDPVPPRFDYFIGMTRFRTDLTFPEIPEVHRVERDGATFTRIRGAGVAPTSGADN